MRVACSATLLASLACASAAHAQVAKPNIILVLTDDQVYTLNEQMPKLKSLVINQGATFTNAYYNDPLCSPSRATILTGKYKQNTGVAQNSYALFAHDEPNTIAVALHAKGYRTALIGKYINGYGLRDGTPVGWDQWFVDTGASADMFNYKMDDNGVAVTFGAAASDYRTDVEADRAVTFVRQAMTAGAPFFLELAVSAPHEPPSPAPRDVGIPEPGIPRDPAFNEANVSDKPSHIANLNLFSPTFINMIDDNYRLQARDLGAVDDAIGRLVNALSTAGELNQTYIVYASDNGWMRGDHRLSAGKGQPYQQSLKIPLVVRGPSVVAGSIVTDLVSNADLAPTFADWAGVTLLGADGRSFDAALRGGVNNRDAEPISYVHEAGANPALSPSWDGVRTTRYRYTRFADGERELYDMRADPNELTNLAASQPGVAVQLNDLANKLNACAGAACRTEENAIPPALR